jgi:hypothetical protein
VYEEPRRRTRAERKESRASRVELWESVVNFINHLAAFWNLLLLIVVFLTLAGFFYTLVIRRMIRVRRIANARDRRLLREAAEREGNSR